ncbi:MAG: glycosyltransferase family 4 protein [bacterium]|nr:glycosyltransferase family 4 protein [bacterium]
MKLLRLRLAMTTTFKRKIQVPITVIPTERDKPRVAIFLLAYEPFVGGAELAVKEITGRLKNDFQFDCFTHKFDKSWNEKEVLGGVAVHRLGKGGEAGDYYGHPWEKLRYVFRAWRAAEAAHRVRPFRLIWAIMASYGGIAALIFKLRHPWVPLLLTLQEGDSEAHILRRVGIFYPLWRMLFRRADRVQVISNYLADFARRHGAKAPVAVIPNGVAIQESKEARKQRSKKAGKQNEVVIVTTSRLVLKNGVDILIRAVAELQKNGGGFRLRIVGGGPEEAKLRALAGKLSVANRVEFLGQVPPEQVPQLLRDADIFARPSRSEGLGSSFLEAMSVGLPVVGTNVGGIPDFLKDPGIVGLKDCTGLFTKLNDPKDLAAKIRLLSGNALLREAIVKNAKKLVERNYQWDGIAERMREVFNVCLRQRSGNKL